VEIIAKKSQELLPRAEKEAEKITINGALDMENKIKKALFLSTISSIKSALSASDITKLKIALEPLNKNKKNISPEDQQALEGINTLISAWEKAPDTQPTPIAKTDTDKKIP